MSVAAKLAERLAVADSPPVVAPPAAEDAAARQGRVQKQVDELAAAVEQAMTRSLVPMAKRLAVLEGAKAGTSSEAAHQTQLLADLGTAVHRAVERVSSRSKALEQRVEELEAMLKFQKR